MKETDVLLTCVQQPVSTIVLSGCDADTSVDRHTSNGVQSPREMLCSPLQRGSMLSFLHHMRPVGMQQTCPCVQSPAGMQHDYKHAQPPPNPECWAMSGMGGPRGRGSKADLFKNALLQGMLVRPEAGVSGSKFCLQARRDLIETYGKLRHVVPEHHSLCLCEQHHCMIAETTSACGGVCVLPVSKKHHCRAKVASDCTSKSNAQAWLAVKSH